MLERRQIAIYFAAVLLAALVAWAVPGTTALERWINPALAFMLFVTFLQVPIASIGSALRDGRFLLALLVANFVAIPLLAFALSQLMPEDGMLRLGILLVLLTPCIDYVITFAHLGRADSRALLASTPILLLAQMALLPVYLSAFLGPEASALIGIGPFVHAFVWLILLPLAGAALVQLLLRGRAMTALGVLPVPATALVLILVVAATVPIFGAAMGAAMSALPIYVAFAVIAPLVGFVVARAAQLPAEKTRAVAFSTATRNSLVVLPLALAVPGALPVLPAVIVTQTLVELVAELVYIRVIARLR